MRQLLVGWTDGRTNRLTDELVLLVCSIPNHGSHSERYQLQGCLLKTTTNLMVTWTTTTFTGLLRY